MNTLALVLLTLTSPAEVPSFSASVESVYVDVSVSQGGEPVLGLTARDFELRDDGQRQSIELVATDPAPPTTLLVVDASSSVAGEKLDRLRRGIESVMRVLRPADELGLVLFNETVRLVAAPSTDRAALRRALRSIQPSGATSLYDALYAGALLASRRGHALVVLFTDGDDNCSWLRAGDVERALGASNVLVQVVGVVPRPQRPQPDIERLAETTGGRFWRADSAQELDSRFEAMLAALRARYVLRFDPALRRPGLHKLTVKLRGRRGEVHCRKTYLVPDAATAEEE